MNLIKLYSDVRWLFTEEFEINFNMEGNTYCGNEPQKPRKAALMSWRCQRPEGITLMRPLEGEASGQEFKVSHQRRGDVQRTQAFYSIKSGLKF